MALISSEHAMFRARVRRYVESELRPFAAEWEAQRGFPRSVFLSMANAGFLGLTYEKRYGGHELDFGYDVVLTEEMTGSRMMGLCLSVVAQNHIFPPLLSRVGTPEQKDMFLVPALRGKKIGCVASTEPTGGSDIVRAIGCAAVEEGDHWVVSGEKKFITNGPIADFVIAIVRTKPELSTTSLSLLIIPTDLPGFTVKTTLSKLGMHTSPTGWLRFDRCRVPKSLTLGRPNVGYFYVARNILEERLIGAVSCVAVAELALTETVTYLRNRIAFGGRLADLQSVRHRVSEMAAEIEMARRFVYSLCEAFRIGRIEAAEICMSKVKVFGMAQRVVEGCLQLHGGDGYLEENWLTRLYRDVRMLTVGGGPSELMKDLVAAYLRL